VRDGGLLARLEAYRRRLRIASLALAALAGAAVLGGALAVAWIAGWPAEIAGTVGLVLFVTTAGVLSIRSWRRWTTARVAAVVERHAPELENLVVTAEEIARLPERRVHPAVRAALFDAALTRLALVAPARVQPLGQALSIAAGALVAVVVLFVALPASDRVNARGESSGSVGTAARAIEPGDLRVVVTPPPYARQRAADLLNPTTVTALEGSTIRIEARVSSRRIELLDLEGETTPFTREGDLTFVQLPATTSRPLLIRATDGEARHDRLVHLRVQRDQSPAVLIREPAKDLIFPHGDGQVRIAIDASDDVGLSSVVLRYTRVSGSGETFTFEEGEWPIEIERRSDQQWAARGVFSLEALKLEDGDTLVYRALARDGKPGADPAASDTFLIEIGRLAGEASTGFALPDDRERQGISQQMLIIKTERLHAERAKLAPEAFAEQSRLLAVEQRMVRAEFVFMTGGEVEDEVEEAAHAHELAEGRLENTGQAELLTAIREMSRAEARLNAADTAQGLEFERAALKALQRAFDRRRYLLRTLPERARIDVSRRLTGELSAAKSSALTSAAARGNPFVIEARALLQELAAVDVDTANLALLASRVLALDQASEDLQRSALQLSAAGDAGQRQRAIDEVQRLLLAAMGQRMSKQVSTPLGRDVLGGMLVEETLRRGRPQ
jgi:hypothetical protein